VNFLICSLAYILLFKTEYLDFFKHSLRLALSMLTVTNSHINWSKRMTASIENAYSLAFMKIFSTYNKEIVTSCQFYKGKLPMEM